MSSDIPLKILPAITGLAGYIGGLFTERVKQKLGSRWATRDLIERIYGELGNNFAQLSLTFKPNSTLRRDSGGLAVLQQSLQFSSVKLMEEHPEWIRAIKGGHYILMLLRAARNISQMSPPPSNLSDADKALLATNGFDLYRGHYENFLIMIQYKIIDNSKLIAHSPIIDRMAIRVLSSTDPKKRNRFLRWPFGR